VLPLGRRRYRDEGPVADERSPDFLPFADLSEIRDRIELVPAVAREKALPASSRRGRVQRSAVRGRAAFERLAKSFVLEHRRA
jgi:hypothetical protein